MKKIVKSYIYIYIKREREREHCIYRVQPTDCYTETVPSNMLLAIKKKKKKMSLVSLSFYRRGGSRGDAMRPREARRALFRLRFQLRRAGSGGDPSRN